MPDRSVHELADLATPWAIRVVVTLDIPELLADGPRPVADLATVSDCDRGYLQRILGHLTGHGLFRQTEPGWFALTESGEQLRGEGAKLSYGLAGIGGRFAYSWSTLLEAVRNGRPAYKDRFGRPFWEDLAAHPDLSAEFDAMMGPVGHGESDPRILPESAWAGATSIVDVGGGAGYDLAALLRHRPELHGTLVELPATAERAAQILADGGVAERSTIVAQSFFDPLPAGADLYLLRAVINDWPDAEAINILTRCAEAAGATGRVLVRGGVASGDHQPGGLEVELVLLGGRVRGLDEFTDLAAQAGLAIRASHDQPPGLVVELGVF